MLDFIKCYRSRVPERIALYYFRQLVVAVQYMHGTGVVHRDLKPENCMIDLETCTLKVHPTQGLCGTKTFCWALQCQAFVLYGGVAPTKISHSNALLHHKSPTISRRAICSGQAACIACAMKPCRQIYD